MVKKELNAATNEEPASAFTKALRGIVKGITNLNKGVFYVCAYTLAILLAVMVFEVLRRYVFHNPSIWGFDFSLWIFAMPALLSGGYLIAVRSHVNMDMIYNKFSPRGKAILDCITSIATFLFLWIMLTQCYKAAVLAITRHEMSITNWKIPIWPVKIWMPVSAGLCILQEIAEFIKNIYLAISGRSLME